MLKMTNSIKATLSLLQPTFVFVRPQMSENIGAASRAMWNFGLDRMRMVAPRDGWSNERTMAMASGSSRLLEEAQVHETTAAAIADCDFVYATTARSRGLTKQIFTPEAAMKDARKRISNGSTVAVLFGPERTGLENTDIARANAIISVQGVNPDFPSLNVAQCVLLMGYEWQQEIISNAPIENEISNNRASQAEIEKLTEHFNERLDTAGFFDDEKKTPYKKIKLRNLWSRMPLNTSEVQILHGILRHLAIKK